VVEQIFSNLDNKALRN